MSADGELLDNASVGTFPPAIEERVARPSLYLDEAVGYEETAWHRELEDGTIEDGYEVRATPTTPIQAVVDDVPVGIDDALAEQLDGLDASEVVAVFVRVVSPEFEPLPRLPPTWASESAESQAAAEQHALLASANAEAFASATADVEAEIVDAGGQVDASFWSIRRIAAQLPAGQVGALSQHPGVLEVELQGIGEDGAACTQPVPPYSQPGGDPVSLGDLRAHTGVQDYLDVGYHGQPSGGPLLVGIHEGSPPEDEACFWDDYGNCNPDDRLKRFDCDSGAFSFETNFPNADEGYHGTLVSSIIVGDYNQGQGSAYEPSIAPGLGPTWRDDATGFGRELEAHYYSVGGFSSGKVAGFECARNLGPGECQDMDIVATQNPLETGVCSGISQLAIEEAVEELWDSGVFTSVITHNQNAYYGSSSSDTCLVRSPADIPKAFAVGALEPDETLPYSQWRYAGYSNRGGGPVVSGGVYYAEGQTMVDLVASGAPGYITTEDGTRGVVDEHGPCSGIESAAGTSYAGPQVAAAAGLVKHRMINHGRTWIDYPGRLHTMMLAHGDRATNTDPGAAPPSIPSCVDGDRLRCGGDKYYGFGRLKLRFHNTYWMHTKTLRTGDQPHTVWVWPGPIGGNREILKCVMQQSESMANKIDISRIRLTVRLFPPHPLTNKCTHWPGMPTFSAVVIDDSPDDKHMVTVLDADTNINGTCVELTLTPTALSSAGAVTTHTYCYVDDELDY